MALFFCLKTKGVIELPHERITGTLNLGQYSSNLIFGLNLLDMEGVQKRFYPVHPAGIGSLGDVEKISGIILLQK